MEINVLAAIPLVKLVNIVQIFVLVAEINITWTRIIHVNNVLVYVLPVQRCNVYSV